MIQETIHLSPWKQTIAIHIASYIENEGYKKGILGFLDSLLRFKRSQ